MLWKQDVEEKHGEEEGGWRSCIGRGGYGVGLWKAIRKGWELFFGNTFFLVGEWERVKFQKDK